MNKTYVLFISVLLILAVSCRENENKKQSEKDGSKEIPWLVKYVKPLIGTKNMGHTFPGATAPFGMVQLSPGTNQETMYVDGAYNPDTYRYCSGYQYDDSTIFGFAHTHFSGTGHSDLGDFLVMPTTGDLQLDPGDANIILDLVYNIYNHDDKNVWTFIRVENDSLVTGFRQTHGWARTRLVYFAMQFSKPFESYGHKKYDTTIYNGFYRKFNENENFPEMAGRNIRAWFSFKADAGEKIKIKFALSNTSTEGALINLEAEIPHWDFAKVKEQTQEKWNNELSKVLVETETPEQKETFYSALYHTMLSPVIYEDVDGQYRGLDQNIHQSDGFTNYTIFSLWDTYRALHPLFNILQPERNNDMVKSMIAHQKESVHHMLPIWSHYANENWCMVGYHSVSVIADAIVKGVSDVDLSEALGACTSTATVSYFDGLGDYINMGYVPEDKSSSSVSKTLEYAYDDWCIAQIARKAGDMKTYDEYMKRAEYFNNVYDPEIGYMRPKLANGEWRAEFDPIDTHGQGFIEGNAWNYGLYVPQDIDKMISMMGGKDAFSEHLDRIFTTEIEDRFIEKNEDITRDGIIGNYVHGNEPGHHIPYLYNWTNDPWKTQERVRMIMDTMYSNGVDGLCGNDDAGQMSAWYIFSALGFYPVLPGSEDYAIGSPMVKEAVISLDNGKTLIIKAENQGPENVYVEKVELNGKVVEGHNLNHFELIEGGTLIYHMTSDQAK